MSWTEETTIRFGELRQKEFAGLLRTGEKEELADLFAFLGAEEKRYLAGVMKRMQAETKASLRQHLQAKNFRLQQRATVLAQERVRLQDIIRQLTNKTGTSGT